MLVCYNFHIVKLEFTFGTFVYIYLTIANFALCTKIYFTSKYYGILKL